MTDILYELNGVSFVWDRRKARENLRSHDGVTFERAAEAFFDPFLRVDDASRNDELRHKVIGFDASNRFARGDSCRMRRTSDPHHLSVARDAGRKTNL
jgi:uncharacterized DUF497 family protein